MFSNNRRDREIVHLQEEVKYLNSAVLKSRCNYVNLLKHLGLEEHYIKEEIILVKKERGNG